MTTCDNNPFHYELMRVLDELEFWVNKVEKSDENMLYRLGVRHCFYALRNAIHSKLQNYGVFVTTDYIPENPQLCNKPRK